MARYALISGFSKSQEFTASANFVVPTGVESVFITGVSGGGGGGGSDTSGNKNGAGGGGSALVERYSVNVTPGDTIAVTLGAGGAGGTGGAGVSTNGADGGTTTFGALLSIPEGLGGLSGDVGTQRVGGIGGGYTDKGACYAGADGAGCDAGGTRVAVENFGNYAGGASADADAGGGGGASYYGAGGDGGDAAAGTSAAATAYGAAGGGGGGASPGYDGGDGADGYMLVEWVG